MREGNKLKFFKNRDWYILHFLLTLVIGIILIVNCVITWISYSDYLKNFDAASDYDVRQTEDIEILKKRIDKLEGKSN